MDLLTSNLKKLYLQFLIPSFGSAMVMSIYTLTDAIVIGKGVGADALAALSITTPLLCICSICYFIEYFASVSTQFRSINKILQSHKMKTILFVKQNS